MNHDQPVTLDALSIENRLLTFVHGELLRGEVAIDRHTNLLSGDLLDSMNVIRLATYVGETFQIEIRAADLIIEHFRDIAAIARYVRRRLTESPEI